MERKKRKYSVDEKVNLAKIVAKHKDEYDNFESKSNYDSKRRKYTNSASGCGYLSKAVRDFYPSLKDKSFEDPEFKKAIQLARRSYNTYYEKQCDEPIKKKTKYRQAGGGRKSVAVEVREKYLFSYFFRINHQTMLYLSLIHI